MLGLVTLHFTVLPLLYLVYLLRQGWIESLDVPQRLKRTRPFAWGVVSYALALLMVLWWRPPGWEPTAWIMGAYLVNTIVAMVINLWWKISVHLMGLSGALAVLVFFLRHPLPGYGHRLSWDPLIWGLLGLVPALMWARLTLRAHSWAQTAIGALYGFGATYGLLCWGWKLYAR